MGEQRINNEEDTMTRSRVCAVLLPLLTGLSGFWATGWAQAPGTMLTVAGTNPTSSLGDGGPATAATVYPNSVAVDGAGNLYIADGENNRIRKVDTSGVITTVAGNGDIVFSGDGGAIGVSVHSPSGVFVDGVGNLYFSDVANHRIRKVDPSGNLTTIAGSGPTDEGSGGFSGDGGPATAARLWYPFGVYVDGGGTLYIADTRNNRIRKVTPGGIITTIAGNGDITGSVGDGGPATAATLRSPDSVLEDGAGNLYIAAGNRIRKVDSNGIITTVAGTGSGFSGDGGPATAARFSGGGVFRDGVGNLYIADTGNNRIRKVDSNGIITTVAGNGVGRFFGDGGPATAASLWGPSGVCVDGAGNLYIADGSNFRIRKVFGPGPTAVTLATFTASEEQGVVTLSWTTTAAHDHAGFHVARSRQPDTGFARLTPTLLTGHHAFQYVDRTAQVNQVYFYQLEAVSPSGETERFGPLTLRVDGPRAVALSQNAPNPCNPATTLRFALPRPATVSLVIYTVLGQEVRRLLDHERREAGFHALRWEGRDAHGVGVASGVYLYRLTTSAGFSQTRRLTVVH